MSRHIALGRPRTPRGVATALLLIATVLGAGACESKPVDTQALLSAQSAGVAFLQRGQLAEAEREFRRVIELAPKDPIGHANLGLTYLRNGQFGQAEEALLRARRLDRRNADVAMMLARLYATTGRSTRAQELLEEMGDDPRALYARAELEAMLGASGDSASLRRRDEFLRRAMAQAPANLALRLRLVEVLIARGLADSAAAQLLEARRFRPEPPREARPPLDSTLRLLEDGRIADARGTFARFHEALKLTSPYQAALEEVKWVEGPLVGRPILAFKPQTLITTRGLLPASRRTEVRFTDVTGEAGLSERGAAPTALALGDYDGDGTDNLLVAVSPAAPGGGGSGARVYNMQGGYVVEVTQRTGIALAPGARFATFADFDNDGWLDLFAIAADGRGVLLRNDGSGRFADVTAAARVGDTGGARRALAADFDHDGDLDLLLVGGSDTRFYRNNLDGTFTESAEAAGLQAPARDAAFGDVDGDGRLDLLVADSAGAVVVLRNTTGGPRRFERAAVIETGGAARLAVADYDNDGWLDVAGIGPGITLWRNVAGRFTRDTRSDLGRSAADVTTAAFVDYDNDGWLDLVGIGPRPVLLHNDGAGRFGAEPGPAALRTVAGAIVTAHDADGDGDQDLFLGDSAAVRLLRNDGGNARMSMQVQLLGMRTGSGKNNNFGIGSRLEVRAGELYQTRVVTERVTHFGLGPHLKADVLRVEWTNGVPQTVYFPGTDQDVLELEMLKGSCAFLYAWDGQRFRFVTDVTWRSALGMPLGIMGATGAAYAPAGASQEYLRIPGEALRPRNGRYTLQITEELWETAYLDQVRLLAVDHPDSLELYVDERFVPPGPVTLRMYLAADRRAPRSARDGRGRDVLPEIRARDGVYLSGLVPLHYQGLVEPHELVMDLGPEAGRPGSHLFLTGWIYPTDASINVALGQQGAVKAELPTLEVRDANGRWKTVETLGFPSGKDKTIVVDLGGRFPTGDHHVRIRTNMRIHWDHVFVATDAATQVRSTPLPVVSADLHDRGFSRLYRKGGSNGPHWFDYDSVVKQSPWRPIEGAFTRFGNVLPLLEHPDDMYVVMGPGDEATVDFDAAPAGSTPTGWTRTFLLYTDGWIKDADLNTAFGNTVEPLPFHANRHYPYASGEAYPADSAHQRYLREYNTRVVRGTNER